MWGKMFPKGGIFLCPQLCGKIFHAFFSNQRGNLFLELGHVILPVNEKLKWAFFLRYYAAFNIYLKCKIFNVLKINFSCVPVAVVTISRRSFTKFIINTQLDSLNTLLVFNKYMYIYRTFNI